MSLRVLKIALLETGTPPDPLLQTHGDYNHMFTQLLVATPSQLHQEEKKDNVPAVQLDIHAFHVTKEPFPLQQVEDFDGFVITGSAANAHDQDEWILALMEVVRVVYQRKKALLGICFGHQVISRALGGITGRSEMGWELGIRVMQLNNAGKESLKLWSPASVAGETSDVQVEESVAISQSHRDQVSQLPKDAILLASSPRCRVEMFQIPAKEPHVLCMQGHPEFNVPFMQELIQLRRGNTFAEKVADQALSELQDEQLVGKLDASNLYLAYVCRNFLVKTIGNWKKAE